MAKKGGRENAKATTKELRVSDVMTLAMHTIRDYPSIPAAATVSHLARIRAEEDLHHFPVVDSGDHLNAMLYGLDVVRVLVPPMAT